MKSTQRETKGVPVLLRKATRWSVIAVASAALVGQLIGVKLISPAYAGIPTGGPFCAGLCKFNGMFRLEVCGELGINPFHPACYGQCVRICQILYGED